MKHVLGMACFWITLASHAAALPPIPSQQARSPHSLFVHSEPGNQGFDSWVIDSGYKYNVFEDVDLYVGTRFNAGVYGEENGFLSGVSYQVNDRLLLKSTLYSANDAAESNSRNDGVSAELSSRLRLSDSLDLHATLDYQKWQQGVELGLGFRF